MLGYKNIGNIKNKSNIYRLKILDLIYKSQKGHIGGSYSIVDLLSYLYLSDSLDHSKKKSINPYVDNICILSKGHCAIAQYVILEDLKFLKKNELEKFNLNGSKLGEHPDLRINGININSGSLGHILSYSTGICYDRFVKNNHNKIYVILGDGELNEGSNWEAFIFLREYNFLKNLVIIIDFNKFMTLKDTKKTINSKLIKNFFKDKKIDFFQVDGHNLNEIDKYFSKIRKSNKLTVVFLNTIKGKGIKFMENKKQWHHRVPNREEYLEGKRQLSKIINGM